MQDITGKINEFIKQLEQSTNSGTFIKLTLSNKKNQSSDLNNVYAKPVMLKDQLMLSFVYRHKTKDITKNFNPEASLAEISRLLINEFSQGLLATTNSDYQLLISKKGSATLLRKAATNKTAPPLTHDKIKSRLVETDNKPFLKSLGIINNEGKLKPDMQDKYRQINKYIEILDGIIKEVDLPDNIKVADMGAGKGYLTFALYDYLTSKLNKEVTMTGVELRSELVESCNTIAKESDFSGLNFVQGTIEKSVLPETDMLIALHACDTATDEAIFKGITVGAKVIVCSPCCHKQVRRDLETSGILAEITQFGILAERQAEILTDTIRALILEAYGYRTNVAEFIATEHTPKNLIISAVKRKVNSNQLQLPDPKVMENIDEIMRLFKLKRHYLKDLMNGVYKN